MSSGMFVLHQNNGQRCAGRAARFGSGGGKVGRRGAEVARLARGGGALIITS